MGNVFYILVWDGFGLGLDMINPRLHTHYDSVLFRSHNSFNYNTEKDIQEFLERHEILSKYKHFKIIK